MTDYICPYCYKIYKTLKGFEKHLNNCKKKENYELLSNYPDLFANMNMICGYLYNKKYYSINNKQFFMANDKNFSKVKNFTDYEVSIDLFGKIDFLTYLIANKISINDWTKEQHLTNFLYDWLYYENEEHAIKRSIKYLNDRGLNIETISPNRLFLALKYGNISVKYLKSINFDWEKNIDCESDEMVRLKYFLRG